MKIYAIHDCTRCLKIRRVVPKGPLLHGLGFRWPACAALYLMLALAAAGVLIGCGRKLPPSPPGVNPPAPVRDLATSLSDGALTLTWSHVAPREKAAVPAAGYKIFRARIDASEKDCTTCPAPFKLVGELLAQTRPSGSTMRFRQELEPGYHYRYKVVAYSGDGANAGDSNVVEATP